MSKSALDVCHIVEGQTDIVIGATSGLGVKFAEALAELRARADKQCSSMAGGPPSKHSMGKTNHFLACTH